MAPAQEVFTRKVESKDVSIFIKLIDSQCKSVFENLSVLFVSLYIDKYRAIEYITEENMVLVEYPCCKFDDLWVSGIANSVRHLLLRHDAKHPLLGYNCGILSGHRDVSPWTRMVEVLFPQQIGGVKTLQDLKHSLAFLSELFEKPFIGHNQRKLRQQAITLGVLPEHGILSHDEWSKLPLMRLYLHGLELCVTDLVIYGMILAKLQFLHVTVNDFKSEITEWSLFYKWINRMNQHVADISLVYSQTISEKVDIFSKVTSCFDYVPLTITLKQLDSNQLKIPNLLPEDLPCTTLTSECLRSVESTCGVIPYFDLHPVTLDWSALQNEIKPQRHNKDNENKMDQLKSILSGVKKVLSCIEKRDDSLRIVDFCSGAGHLGIFLAYFLPECHIILVETKWGSLNFAQKRIQKLGLKNVTLCLCHMNHFTGHFDVGVSLHACGTATDMVIKYCTNVNASIVSSPCCYGKIKTSNLISYPRSAFIKDKVSAGEFIRISKMADMEEGNEKFMKFVDIDRIYGIAEKGYNFINLCKLHPLTCSPKNNLIVAYRYHSDF